MAAWHETLRVAQGHAQNGSLDACVAACREIVAAHAGDAEALLSVGALLLDTGSLTLAGECFERVRAVAPHDLRPVVNLASVARDGLEHGRSRELYDLLLEHLPDHPVVRRNALVSLEYDSAASDAERLARAREWGGWAVARAGGVRPRPPLRVASDRPLRVGYVSADFCQHTVGLFVKDVLATHEPARVLPHAYNAGYRDDWVTDAIRKACVYRNVAALDDAALAETIRADEIDVLVDLSGHTAGSRLMMFAHRPAPIQASWLGYFATTGLDCIDAVLLDDWHAPAGTEAQFVERIVPLPRGRFCYVPVPWAPQVAASPCIQNGYVTFGCFNNTAKLNGAVFDVWARILKAVPDSRLVLKWRTFGDEGLCRKVHAEFACRGIATDRIELRGASFHADMLKQYAGIDIALDPFPFTGGLTSCEALWMGVPVVTWPQARVVSRQTFALLSAIGLEELAATDADDYVHIATALAANRPRLAAQRVGMRQCMLASPLMDVAVFTAALEEGLLSLANAVSSGSSRSGSFRSS